MTVCGAVVEWIAVGVGICCSSVVVCGAVMDWIAGVGICKRISISLHIPIRGVVGGLAGGKFRSGL